MWAFNPTRPNIFRSPPFKVDQTNSPLNLPLRRKVSQFGKLAQNIDSYVPGPLVRDQPVTNRPIQDQTGYPGLAEPTPSNYTVFPQVQGKHFSNGVFYNQQLPNQIGYGASPYWHFAQWSLSWPEYFILNVQGLIYAYSIAVAGNPEAHPPTSDHYEPHKFTSSQGGTMFLMRRSEGFLFKADGSGAIGPNYGSRTGSWFDGLIDRDIACCASWIPIYDIGNHDFPNPAISWQLSFRPLADADSVGPMSWTLSMIDYTDIQTHNYIEFNPFPSGGSFILAYVYNKIIYLTGPINIPNTGILLNDIETLRTRIGALLNSGDFSATVTTNTTNPVTYSITIDGPAFAKIQLSDTFNLVHGNVRAYQNTEAPPFIGREGDVIYLTPSSGFRSLNQYVTMDPEIDITGNPTGKKIRVVHNDPEVTCKDTRAVGAADSSFELRQVFGEQRTLQGLSYGSISSALLTHFRVRTVLVDCLLNSDTQFLKYPGRPNDIFESYTGNPDIILNDQASVTITPVTL